MTEPTSLDDGTDADWRSERLWLRLLDEQDCAPYVAVYTDAGLMRHVGQPLSLAQAETGFQTTLLENARRPWRRLTWLLHEPGSTDVIGLLGVVRDPGDASCAEIGAITQPRWQGRGLAGEAVRALVARCLATPSIRTLLVRHHVDNAAGMAIARAAGFVPAPEEDIDCWRLWRREAGEKAGIAGG